MVKKLNKEAIDEIMYLLNEVNDVVRLLDEFGIHIDSDCWSATNPINHNYENILSWNRKNFETLDISNIKSFNIGGNITTGYQHKYKDKVVIAPKDLAEVQEGIFTKYLVSIINSVSLKHFKLKLDEPFGLINNCGWECYLVIEATVQKSAIIDNDTETKKLVEKIKNEEDVIIELSGSPVNKNPSNKFFSKESNLQPQGNFAYMIEFFSDLIIDEDTIYQGAFGVNSKYIKDAMKLITKVENRAKEIEEKYAEKGVKATVNGLNDGCEKGMAIYVWIPYQ